MVYRQANLIAVEEFRLKGIYRGQKTQHEAIKRIHNYNVGSLQGRLE